MEKQQDDELVIDLGQLFEALLQRFWVILLAMLVCGAAAFCYARFLITPTYQASALMYVNNSSISVGSTSVSLSDLSASKTLVDTYIVILKTRLTLNKVIEDAGLAYTYEDLYKMISAKAVNNTEIFEITVTSTSPREAERIANTIVEVLPGKIAEVMDGSSVRTVDFAVVPEKKFAPSITKYTAIGLLLGAVLSCGVIVLLVLLDQQIRDEDYLRKTYYQPILAVIPDLMDTKALRSKRYSHYAPKEGEAS